MSFIQYLQEQGLSPSSQRTYLHCLANFEQWYAGDAQHATQGDLTHWLYYLREQPYRPAYIAQHVRALRHWFAYLGATNQPHQDPCSHLYLQPAARRIPHDLLSAEYMRQLYQRYPRSRLIDRRNLNILGLFCFQALRPEEVAGLTPDDLDWDNTQIKIKATTRAAERIIPLTAEQILPLFHYWEKDRQELITQRDHNHPGLFMSAGSSPLLKNTLDLLLKNLKKQWPQLKHWQQVRQSVIVQWLRQHNLRQVQYWAGHRYISSTERYSFKKLEALRLKLKTLHPMESFRF